MNLRTIWGQLNCNIKTLSSSPQGTGKLQRSVTCNQCDSRMKPKHATIQTQGEGLVLLVPLNLKSVDETFACDHSDEDCLKRAACQLSCDFFASFVKPVDEDNSNDVMRAVLLQV